MRLNNCIVKLTRKKFLKLFMDQTYPGEPICFKTIGHSSVNLVLKLKGRFVVNYV